MRLPLRLATRLCCTGAASPQPGRQLAAPAALAFSPAGSDYAGALAGATRTQLRPARLAS